MVDQARTTALAAILTIASHAGGGFAEEKICEIQILDEENGWPVPIVELRTTNSVRFFSASRFRRLEWFSEKMGQCFHTKGREIFEAGRNLVCRSE
jgi:hypothetical protein